MDLQGDPAGIALLAVGSVLLLGSAAGLFTGNPNVLEYAVPVALAGVAAVFLGVRRLEATDEAGA